MLRLDGGMTFAELEDMEDEELLAVWEAFVAHCEERNEAMKARMAEQQAAMPKPHTRR